MLVRQKAILALLAFLALTALGVSAGVIFFGGLRPVAAAVAPAESPQPALNLSPTSTVPPTLTTTPRTAYSPTPTPFQPLPLTATPSPSSTPTQTPLPTPTPSPTPFPTATSAEDVYISGIWGFQQTYNLSCESRSASDFARYFDVSFTELEFLFALPSSDNPEVGFVGDVQGYLGQLPPLGYGVHAKPVARLMRDFGLDAKARKGMTLELLKSELAAGRPVMIWAIAEMGYSSPVEYTASDGETTIVARFEHTFVVIGYGTNYITLLDNDKVYSVTTDQFMTSWGVLGNMGITINP